MINNETKKSVNEMEINAVQLRIITRLLPFFNENS